MGLLLEVWDMLRDAREEFVEIAQDFYHRMLREKNRSGEGGGFR